MTALCPANSHIEVTCLPCRRHPAFAMIQLGLSFKEIRWRVFESAKSTLQSRDCLLLEGGVYYRVSLDMRAAITVTRGMKNWESEFEAKISAVATLDDPAHDLLHFQRVVKTAKLLCAEENAKFEVVVPAAWLHDMVIVPKSDPRRFEASRLSSAAAVQFLREIGYNSVYFGEIAHAIECHSFSANTEPTTIEAAIIQDADRLDGLGAIGIARLFATAGIMKSQLYSPDDPFCKTRSPADEFFAVDHFYQKLFKVVESLRTNAGRAEGKRRSLAMKSYLDTLRTELN